MKNPRSFRIQGMFILAALVVQYLLGMYVNLFVSFPQGAQGGQLWEFAWSQGSLASHIVLGILIALGGILFAIRAFYTQGTKVRVASVLGLLAVLGAGGSGAAFVATQMDWLSYSMSFFFLLAFTMYFWATLAAPKVKSQGEAAAAPPASS